MLTTTHVLLLMTDESTRFSESILRDDPPPPMPVEPDMADCCGNGCDPCIFDLYEEAKQHYRECLAAWCQRHPGMDLRAFDATVGRLG